MKPSREEDARGVRRALAIGLVGVVVQLAGGLHWTPGSFVVSAAIGLPLVLVGAALFVRTAWRAAGRDEERAS